MMRKICCCGLLTKIRGSEDFPVPLAGVSVEANIIDLVAEVTIEQSYVNKENSPIETVYKFPLDEGAAVCGFSAEIDDRIIQGVVKETKEAQKDYASAIASGRSAALLEEKLPDVFKAKVGNLPAGSAAKIRLTYVTELKVEIGEIRFYLPTTIAPRYVPANDQSSAARDVASIPYTIDTPFKMECNIRVKTASAIQGIRCPTNQISTINLMPSESHVRLAEEMTAMDRDLVLYVQVAEPHQPRLIYEKSDDNSAALMLSIVPSFRLAVQKTELIFVVDRSGSMDGPAIEQARRALSIFLHSLPVDSCVNIVGFGSDFKALFTSSQRYSDKILKETEAYVASVNANLGGTEIYKPLRWIFQQPLIEGYSRQVLVLTDGEVSNDDEIISLVKENQSKARVFALGLGSSASHYLVEGIAQAGNGTALFASIEERLERKVMKQLQDSLQPAMTDVTLQWNGMDKPNGRGPVQTLKTLLGYGKPIHPESAPEITLRQAPSQCPPVFDGRHLVVYALLNDKEKLPSSVTLSASSPVGPLSVTLPLSESHFENDQIIHKMAAKRLIQELQDKRNEADKQDIIELGCKYGLTSRYTSFVAVDPKKHAERGDCWMIMKSREVPNTLPRGWRGFALVDSCDYVQRGGGKSQISIGETCDGMKSNYCMEGGGEIYEKDKDDLTELIRAQRFDGSFDISDVFAKLLKTSLKDIEQAGKSLGYAESVWATALALALLALTMSDHQESWALVATKAEIWISGQLQAHPDKAKHDAEAFIKSKLKI